jgi:molybdopterin-guanine dinucleotide biosynthesis protein A
MYHRPMAAAPADLTAFILAGGKSSRMGSDKAFVELDGRTLLARALDITRSVTPNVCIVGDPAKFSTFAATVEDIFPNCGPLAGIHAALHSSQTDLNLILAVDLPFVSSALLQFLIARAKSSTHSTVTVPRTTEGWQPLCALYRHPFAELADESLRDGSYKIDKLFSASSTQTVTEQELETAGLSPKMFRNLNTPQDLLAARTR